MAKKFFKLSDKQSEVRNLSSIGNKDVIRCGISALDEIIGFKKGYPVFIGGAPHSGKTEIGLEWLVNLSILKQFKWFCYFGEGGSIESMFLEIMHKYLGKPYAYATESEKAQAEYFANEYFVIANDDLDYMIGGFYTAVSEAEKEYSIKFDGTFFDPFNDIEEELLKFSNREDKFLAYALKEVRKSSKFNKRIDFIVNHIASIKAMIDAETKNRYYPPAMQDEWAGGRTWWRRAFLMVLIYRPPAFLQDQNGRNYEKNETHVICQKAKPKGIASLGQASVYWDWKKNRYFSVMPNGQILYSCETPESIQHNIGQPKIQPSKDFTESIKEHEGDVPF